MDNKKFEQLIELIINENEEKARELFHDIVVEKSREIYESIMDEEMMEAHEEGMEEGAMVGEVGDLMDEISAEESGVVEAEDEEDIEFDDEAEEAGDDMVHDLEKDHDEGEDAEDLEDRVVKVEDKLDELMAEFEQIMGGGDMGDDMGDEEEVAGDEEMMEAADDEEDVTEAKEDEEDAVEESIAEAVQLQKVSVTHGDNGSNPKSIALHEPKVKTAGVKPVKFSGDHETVPTGPKGPSNYGSKGEKEVPGAGSFKNAPGGKSAKLDKAPAAKTGQASGVNNKSPVAKG